MSDNELWQAFLYEVNEQLEALEQTLMAMQGQFGQYRNDQEAINGLFRYFHSIKSSCAMFEFDGMEDIAHAAESVLDEIRKGITALLQEHLDLLLKAVDCLKEQLAEAEAGGQAPRPRLAMLQELQACIVGGKQEMHDDEKQVNALGVDPLVMEEFAMLSMVCLQRFVMAMKSLGMGLDNASPEEAVTPLKKWLRAANALEFRQLADDISRLVQLAESQSALDSGAALSLLAQLVDQLKTLEEISGQPFALDEIYPWLENFYLDHMASSLGALYQQLQACLPARNAASASIDVRQLDALCESVDELLKLFRLFGFTGSRDLLRYFNQLCRKAILGQLSLDTDTFSLLHGIISAHRQALGNYPRQQAVDRECEALVSALRQQVSRGADDAFGRQQRLATLTATLGMPADYLDYIENSDIESLEYAVQAGKTIVLALVDLEADHDWSNLFVRWLDHAQIITSRTVFCQKETNGQWQEYTKTSFLLVFDHSPQHISTSLSQLPGSDTHVESLFFCNKPEAAQPARQAQALSAGTAAMPGGAMSGNTVPGTPASVTPASISAVSETANEGEIHKADSARSEGSKSIRIGSDVIDRFVVQVGEMVLRRNMLSHAIHNRDIDVLLKKCKAILDNSRGDTLGAEQLAELKDSLGGLSGFFDQLLAANEKLDHSVSFVQEEVMSLRVVPIGIVFNRLPRIVRHINSEYGKNIQLDITGEEVRVDKSMVDILMEPLVHLVRNCADHGIESAADRQRLGKIAPAAITVSAEQAGNTLLIRIADNGAGLDYRKIRDKAIRNGILPATAEWPEEQLKQLIFAPGFSTSDTVTETSGRGVGMDAVKTSLVAIGGNIDVQSVAGEGTVFTLKVPVSAAIQGVIVFRHQGEVLTIPERNVVSGLTVPVSEIQSVQGQAAFIYQGDIIPVYGLGQLLRWTARQADARATSDTQEMLIITDDSYHMALAVDKVIGRQEIFVRNLHSDLMSLPAVGGASILGNGQVALILNCEELMQIAARNAQNIETLLRVS